MQVRPTHRTLWAGPQPRAARHLVREGGPIEAEGGHTMEAVQASLPSRLISTGSIVMLIVRRAFRVPPDPAGSGAGPRNAAVPANSGAVHGGPKSREGTASQVRPRP